MTGREQRSAELMIQSPQKSRRKLIGRNRYTNTTEGHQQSLPGRSAQLIQNGTRRADQSSLKRLKQGNLENWKIDSKGNQLKDREPQKQI
jgi:hypothetical protein